jgi:hypothetical protein
MNKNKNTNNNNNKKLTFKYKKYNFITIFLESICLNFMFYLNNKSFVIRFVSIISFNRNM